MEKKLADMTEEQLAIAFDKAQMVITQAQAAQAAVDGERRRRYARQRMAEIGREVETLTKSLEK